MKQLDERVDVSVLDLDPNNPRLPEGLNGAEQWEILKYLYDHDVLEELIDSFLANGYFESEPVIVLPASDQGRRIVAEGNRRLAAMMILHQLPPAIAAEIELSVEPKPDDEQLVRLRALPAVEAVDHNDVASYLGFRHISGLKRWGPEAKARWLHSQVDRAAERQSERGVFYDVGRSVGSNARGVRSAYVAYGILRHARDILKVENRLVDYVSQDRFGVWTRLLGTANVTEYIGMGTRVSPTYEGVRSQIEAIARDRISDVLSDLTPTERGERPILGDSRDVTDYSDVLANERASAAMREFRSLSLAVEIAKQAELASRLNELTRTIELLTLDVRRYEIGEEDVAAADALAAATRTLKGAISQAAAEDDE